MKLSKILSRHAAGPLVALAALSPSVTQAADMPRAQREYMTGYLTGIDSFLAEADARARPYADYHPHSSKVTHNAQTGYTDGRNCAIELAFDVVSDPRVFLKYDGRSMDNILVDVARFCEANLRSMYGMRRLPSPKALRY